MDQDHLDKWLKKRRQRRNELGVDMLFQGIREGNKTILSTAITLLESSREDDRKIAAELINRLLPFTGKSIRIGITGVPGVGKSTFIESFGQLLLKDQHKVAVLAIDPSSGISGGSILGDKTRMNDLSQEEGVFIRPSPAGSTLGGVARKTRETILLCEAAGFDVILIETVGVGQSETVVHSMVDFFLLLMLSGAGDELQGIKRGIMEMADALIITKADGDNVRKAKAAAKEYQNAMHLFPPKSNEWIPRAMTCSSVNNENISEVWELILSCVNQVKINGWFERNRHEQDTFWFQETLKELILERYFHTASNEELIHRKEEQIRKGELSSFQGAEEAFRELINKNDGEKI